MKRAESTVLVVAPRRAMSARWRAVCAHTKRCMASSLEPGETLSPAVSRLFAVFARTQAQRHWRGMRCDDFAAAVGVLAWLLRRRWGLTAL